MSYTFKLTATSCTMNGKEVEGRDPKKSFADLFKAQYVRRNKDRKLQKKEK